MPAKGSGLRANQELAVLSISFNKARGKFQCKWETSAAKGQLLDSGEVIRVVCEQPFAIDDHGHPALEEAPALWDKPGIFRGTKCTVSISLHTEAGDLHYTIANFHEQVHYGPVKVDTTRLKTVSSGTEYPG